MIRSYLSQNINGNFLENGLESKGSRQALIIMAIITQGETKPKEWQHGLRKDYRSINNLVDKRIRRFSGSSGKEKEEFDIVFQI